MKIIPTTFIGSRVIMGESELLASRSLMLEQTPKWLWRYICRCRKYTPLHFDTTRLIWCCDVCSLPWTYSANIWDRHSIKFISTCFGCGNDFVVWIITRPLPDFCGNCDGDNFALPGQRTENPHIEIDYEKEDIS